MTVNETAKSLRERLEESRVVLEQKLGGRKPEVGIILGSGLGPLAEQVENAVCVPFAEIPHMKRSTTVSHVGRFVCGELAGKCVIVMQGRLHGYEGNTSEQVAYPVWLMSLIGIHTLIASNAAGAINASYQVGDFCLMKDHINFTGRNPIVGTEPNEIAFRFFSMYDAYDPGLRKLALDIANERGIRVREGVYLGLLGPSFETPAEIRAFRAWGADTVAMSVVEEVIAARHVDLRVMGVSLVSNMACGVENANPNDVEVMETAKRAEADFAALITSVVERMDVHVPAKRVVL